MGKADRIITKVHRVSGGLFLLAMVPAGYASFKRDTASLLVYLPLPFLFALILTGLCQLVAPPGSPNSTCRQQKSMRSIP